jgi:hypothetical protein
MDRTTVVVTTFFVVAGGALATMIITGRSKHPVAHAAAAPVPAEPTRAEVIARARAGTQIPEGPRPSDAGDMEAQVGAMRMPPPGYRAGNAQNFMKMRLRELMMAEEQAYQELNTYTADMSKLMLAKRTGDVVVLRVISAGPAGFSAEATHPAMPGKSCVIYAGPVSSLPGTPQTLTDHTQPLGERDLVCDKP